MGGFGMFMMMAWMPLMIIFWVIVIAVVAWLVVRALNQKKTPTLQYTPPERSEQPYEQGYQPRQQAREPSPKNEEQVRYPYPTDEQPQAQYPQPQEMPPQR